MNRGILALLDEPGELARIVERHKRERNAEAEQERKRARAKAELEDRRAELGDALVAITRQHIDAVTEQQIAERAAGYKQFRADWKAFQADCAREGLASLPAWPETVAQFVLTQPEDASAKRLKRLVASIGRAHKLGGHPDPAEDIAVCAALRFREQALEEQAAIDAAQQKGNENEKN